jgi:hypothetical protein
LKLEAKMAEPFPFDFHWIADPGPEVYQHLANLPPDQRGQIVSVINAARGELEAARVKGYNQIGAALANVASAGAAKR